jgi:hypothetical protein
VAVIIDGGRDLWLWLRQDLGRAKSFTAEIPAHGRVLLRVN